MAPGIKNTMYSAVAAGIISKKKVSHAISDAAIRTFSPKMQKKAVELAEKTLSKAGTGHLQFYDMDYFCSLHEKVMVAKGENLANMEISAISYTQNFDITQIVVSMKDKSAPTAGISFFELLPQAELEPLVAVADAVIKNDVSVGTKRLLGIILGSSVSSDGTKFSYKMPLGGKHNIVILNTTDYALDTGAILSLISAYMDRSKQILFNV